MKKSEFAKSVNIVSNANADARAVRGDIRKNRNTARAFVRDIIDALKNGDAGEATRRYAAALNLSAKSNAKDKDAAVAVLKAGLLVYADVVAEGTDYAVRVPARFGKSKDLADGQYIARVATWEHAVGQHVAALRLQQAEAEADAAMQRAEESQNEVDAVLAAQLAASAAANDAKKTKSIKERQSFRAERRAAYLAARRAEADAAVAEASAALDALAPVAVVIGHVYERRAGAWVDVTAEVNATPAEDEEARAARATADATLPAVA